MSVAVEELPSDVRRACTRLRDELLAILGSDLVALWAYGAATRPDRPKRLGDVDTHGVLSKRPPDQATARAIDDMEASIGRDCNIEWDSWFIVEEESCSGRLPKHAFRVDLPDWAWALHRAHWLAGHYVLLHGKAPGEIVRPPTPDELAEALAEELCFVEELLQEGKDDPRHAAFEIWQACRVIYSIETGDVVVSKRAAAAWALANLDKGWGPAIRAAQRAYDDELAEGDDALLKSTVGRIVGAARERVNASD